MIKVKKKDAKYKGKKYLIIYTKTDTPTIYPPLIRSFRRYGQEKNTRICLLRSAVRVFFNGSMGESAQDFLVKQTFFRSICLFVSVGFMQVSADVTSGGYGSEGTFRDVRVSRQDHKSAVVTMFRLAPCQNDNNIFGLHLPYHNIIADHPMSDVVVVYCTEFQVVLLFITGPFSDP